MNTFLTSLKNETNIGFTENGAVKRLSSMSGLLDLFGMGAAYRSRSDEDCIVLFQKAFKENPTYALKCLFYLRDVRGGQGERRFFRVICKYLANVETEAMERNIKYVPEYGRWDDLYTFVGTKLQSKAFECIKNQLAADMISYDKGDKEGISLLAKWLKSENTSSSESRALANKTRAALGMNHKEYRKMLSLLRERINILERLMSAGKWDEIEFDKIPSKAGIQYRNAFARHDIERMTSEKQVVSYEDFIKDEKTTVNAKTLYPYEVVAKAYNLTSNDFWGSHRTIPLDNTERLAINKYWDNLADVLKGYSFNGLCVCDTSGSMWGSEASAPINVAISIALYCAEKAKGPFHGHYISFSSRPQLIETYGVDFVDKVRRIYQTNLCENTNIEATFDMVLNTALKNHVKQEDMPENLIIISDMEFDYQRGRYGTPTKTLMENIELKWNQAGYKMPNLVYWCVQARHDNVPMKIKDGVSLVSGMSPVIFEQIMKGVTALDLVLDKLNSERYTPIH